MLDSRVTVTGALLLGTAGLVGWRLAALRRHHRTYRHRLSTERWSLRFEADRIRQRSQQSARTFVLIAGMWASLSVVALGTSPRPQMPPDWPANLALTVWFFFGAVHHHRAAETLTRELAALDALGDDTTARPLGLQ